MATSLLPTFSNNVNNSDVTVQEFKIMVDKNLPIKNRKELENEIMKYIKVAFEKAVDEPCKFLSDYSTMVAFLCEDSSSSSVVGKTFRKCVLEQCRRELQKMYLEEETIKKLQYKVTKAKIVNMKLYELSIEVDSKIFEFKRRYLGIMGVIGELFKLKIIFYKILADVVIKLIRNCDEISLECVCKLLIVVGEEIDRRYSSSSFSRIIPEDQCKWMTRTYSELEKLSTNFAISPWIRIALSKLIQLLKENWKPRKFTYIAGNKSYPVTGRFKQTTNIAPCTTYVYFPRLDESENNSSKRNPDQHFGRLRNNTARDKIIKLAVVENNFYIHFLSIT